MPFRVMRNGFFISLEHAIPANWFSVVWRRLDAEPQPTLSAKISFSLVKPSGKRWPAAVFLVWLFQKDWRGVPFVLEHCAKTVAFFLALIPGSALPVTLWRLAGGQARDFMDAPLLAATPLSFGVVTIAQPSSSFTRMSLSEWERSDHQCAVHL
jgi:hypothetical protein